MQGVSRYAVQLMAHDPSWEREFLEVKEMLYNVFPGQLLDVQWVGSTAIPAICAKPVLDVAVRFSAIGELDAKALTDKGYDYCGSRPDDENRHLFVLRRRDEALGEEISLQHIHCYGPDNPGFNQLVGFRDYLNSHPEEAAAYEGLKRSLAVAHPDDRASYTKGKAAFIQSIFQKMEEKS